MRTIFEACEPRADVLSGELRDEMFAAKLEDVVRGSADPIYQDPQTFFSNTHPTGGLQTLLAEALGRISGKRPDAAPVIRLETAFGGGKTHSLIALYHFARGARPDQVNDYVDSDLLPKSPVRVAAIVGNALDPAMGVDHGDVTTRTIWGEIAYQLGSYEDLQGADAEASAPGVHTLEKVFGTAPTLVLLDELARYLEVTEAVKVGDSTLADQTTAFLMALLEFATSAANVAVAYTLASSSDAFAQQTEEIRTLVELRAVSARVEHVITPSAENEIAAILRHRLLVRERLIVSDDVRRNVSVTPGASSPQPAPPPSLSIRPLSLYDGPLIEITSA